MCFHNVPYKLIGLGIWAMLTIVLPHQGRNNHCYFHYLYQCYYHYHLYYFHLYFHLYYHLYYFHLYYFHLYFNLYLLQNSSQNHDYYLKFHFHFHFHQYEMFLMNTMNQISMFPTSLYLY